MKHCCRELFEIKKSIIRKSILPQRNIFTKSTPQLSPSSCQLIPNNANGLGPTNDHIFPWVLNLKIVCI